MNILIDPYMFDLTDEKEIHKNVAFFMDVINLCMDQNNDYTVAIYKDMYERIIRMHLQPFPISLNLIRDSELRATVKEINKLFVRVMLPSIENMDIDACTGDQEFDIVDDVDIKEDDLYFDMLYMLLIPCYKKEKAIDNRILTGEKEKGKHIGEEFQIKCSCTEKQYEKKCCFVGIDTLIADKDKAVRALKQKKEKGEIPVGEIVPAVIGDHHNHVEPNEKKFETLDELSLDNRNVLELLQELGLCKVIFGRFSPHGTKQAGTMRILNVSQKETQDILTVKFNAVTGFYLETELYFPKGVGNLIYTYFQGEQLVYKNVSELVEALD